MLLSKLFRKKVIVHIHGAEFHAFYQKEKMSRPLMNFFINKADVVLCLSKSWKDFFEKNFRPKKLRILNNVTTSIKTDHKNISNSYKDGIITFLFLGLIGNQKEFLACWT